MVPLILLLFVPNFYSIFTERWTFYNVAEKNECTEDN